MNCTSLQALLTSTAAFVLLVPLSGRPALAAPAYTLSSKEPGVSFDIGPFGHTNQDGFNPLGHTNQDGAAPPSQPKRPAGGSAPSSPAGDGSPGWLWDVVIMDPIRLDPSDKFFGGGAGEPLPGEAALPVFTPLWLAPDAAGWDAFDDTGSRVAKPPIPTPQGSAIITLAPSAGSALGTATVLGTPIPGPAALPLLALGALALGTRRRRR